jgi:GNAT superfamily N-acetyltransferase
LVYVPVSAASCIFDREMANGSSSTIAIRRVTELDERLIGTLAEVTKDCVDGGASIGFMQPFTREKAVTFWRKIAGAVAAEQRVLLIAEDDQGVCGTVQLIVDLPDNQPHRADLAKMQVHRRARRRGLGAALLRAAEDTARSCGKTLLVLDAVTDGEAARLYANHGWVRVGDIPNFALFPDGRYCSTTYFYKELTI